MILQYQERLYSLKNKYFLKNKIDHILNNKISFFLNVYLLIAFVRKKSNSNIFFLNLNNESNYPIIAIKKIS